MEYAIKSLLHAATRSLQRAVTPLNHHAWLQGVKHLDLLAATPSALRNVFLTCAAAGADEALGLIDDSLRQPGLIDCTLAAPSFAPGDWRSG